MNIAVEGSPCVGTVCVTVRKTLFWIKRLGKQQYADIAIHGKDMTKLSTYFKDSCVVED